MIAAGTGLVVLVGAGCSSDEQSVPSEKRASEVCEVFGAIDWESPRVTADDSAAEVEAKFDQDQRDEMALVQAATGELRRTAERVLDLGEQFRSAFLNEWQAAGDGQALSEVASEAGFNTSRRYVESQIFDDPQPVRDERRKLSSQLAAECEGLLPADSDPLSEGEAPDGEILAVKLESNEIHRFSTTGKQLGELALPGVDAPIWGTTLSPDGHRLAFLAGTDDVRMWVLELDTGEINSTTAPTCMDWAADSIDLWASVDTPPNEYVTRISTDGAGYSGSDLDINGCPYRYSDSALAIHRPPVDGAFLQIHRAPTNGSPPEPLVTMPCDIVAPNLSTQADELVLTVGCRTDSQSGVYLASRYGNDLRQIFSGVAAAATWSPDGAWVTFGAYSPGAAGDTNQTRVLISTSDGATIASITPPGYSWPIWVEGPTLG